MNREQYLLDHLQLSTGPKWEGEIIVVEDDGSIRLATPKEIDEAAEFMIWVRDWLDDRDSD